MRGTREKGAGDGDIFCQAADLLHWNTDAVSTGL